MVKGIQRAYDASNVQLVLEAWETWSLHWTLKVYLMLGLLLGLVGAWSYAWRSRKPKIFYDFTYWFYSSKTMVPLSTAFVLFARYRSQLLYTNAFWGTFAFFWILSWFPRIVLGAVLCIIAWEVISPYL